MADYEYGGGGEDLSSTQPFQSDYIGYDPRLPSQRFDSSQRFDESFRAQDHFAPTFGDDVKEDGEDEYKGANGFGYHHADAPSSYGFEDDLAGHPEDAPSAYVPTFEPDPANEFGGEVNYTSANPVSGNGFGGAHDESLFTGVPTGNGPSLPEPEDMREEGSKLREWKRENAIRLEDKERKERENLHQIIADADYYKDEMFVKRKNTMENGRKTNRDKEKVFLTNQENFHKNADKQYWKAVAELIPNELPTIDTKGPTAKKDKKEKERKPSIVAIKGPKPGKPTDVTRMRQILLKLKHTPPPHMKPPPPPPAPEKEKDAKAKDGKDAKDPKGKDAKDKDGKEKTVPTAPAEGDTASVPAAEPAIAEPETLAPAAAAVTA